MPTVHKEAKKIMIAVMIALVAVILVVGFVTWQQPDAEAPPMKAPALAPMMTAPSSEVQTSARAALERAKPPAKNETKPAPAAKPRPPVDPSTSGRMAKAPPPPRPRRATRRPAPAPRPAPPPPPPTPVASTQPRGGGFKVKFRSLEVLESLVSSDHVAVILEYADGTRLLLPRELDGELVTLNVPDDRFEGWVAEGRVSELQPTAALLDRLRVHTSEVRYLAVLSPEIRDSITQEADRARVSAERSVMVIDASAGRPEVSVLLARR